MQQTATHCAITLSMNQPLSRPSATLSPPCGERAGRGVPIWFMAPIHVQSLEVSASHEPENAFVDFHGLTHFRFMGREQVRKEHGTFHDENTSTSIGARSR